MNLKLVTLDYFYNGIDDPLVWSFFGKLGVLRREGYGPDYPKNFLPLDIGDYIGRHHLICALEDGELNPIGGFRNLLLSRCDQYALEIPLLRVLRDSHAPDHARCLEESVSICRNENRDLVYSSSLTVKKAYRQVPGLSAWIVELCFALLYEDFVNSRSLFCYSGAATRFHTDRAFSRGGYQFICDKKGEPLPEVRKVSAGGEPILLMGFDRTSEYMKASHEKNREILQNRIHLGSAQEQVEKKAA